MATPFDPLSVVKDLAALYVRKQQEEFKDKNEGLSPVERLSALASGTASEELKDNYYNDVTKDLPNAMGTVGKVPRTAAFMDLRKPAADIEVPNTIAGIKDLMRNLDQKGLPYWDDRMKILQKRHNKLLDLEERLKKK